MTDGSGDGAPSRRSTRETTTRAERSGLGALIAKHPTAWLSGALAVAFLLLGTGAVYAGASSGSAQTPAATATNGKGGDAEASPEPTPTVEPPRPVPDPVPAASRLRTCSIAALASDPRLAQFQGYVLNSATGEVLFDRGGGTPARTGSVLKILTAAAAVSALGPGYQLSTKVYRSAPGTLVLVGGGDATLSRLAPGQESFYRGAPKLADLASGALAQLKQKYPDEPITQLVLDASYWNPADKWDPAWKRTEQTIGYHSEVTALQVDGDRADPTRSTSPRSTDPIGRAGGYFFEALRAADDAGLVSGNVAISQAALGGGGEQLAEVKSQPVSALVNQMLLVSDNTIAEMLARVTSRAMGLNGSASSLQQAIPKALEPFGVDPAGMTIKDGSGLSEFNAVSPAWVSQFMVKVIAGVNSLGVVYDGLPVAGQKGSLASRFTGGNAVARGAVIAKTGWIDTAYSLAGVVNARDGSRLTFAFYAIGNVSDNAKAALDTLTTGVYSCGDNLSNS